MESKKAKRKPVEPQLSQEKCVCCLHPIDKIPKFLQIMLADKICFILDLM